MSDQPECDVCDDQAMYRLEDSGETYCVFHISEAGKVTEGVEILTDTPIDGPPSRPSATAGTSTGFANAAAQASDEDDAEMDAPAEHPGDDAEDADGAE